MSRLEHALSVARVMAATDEYLNAADCIPADIAADLPRDFMAEVNLPYLRRNEISQFNDAYATEDELLDASWSAAVQVGAVRYYEGKIVFPIDAMRSDGETPLEVSIRQGDPERSGGRAWFVSYVNTYVPPVVSHANIPTKAIEEFAWMGP